MLFSSLSRSRVSITYTSHTDDPPPLLPVGVSSSILLKALLPTVRNSAVHQVRTSLLVQHDRTRSIFPFMVNAAIGHSRSTTLNHGDHSHSRPDRPEFCPAVAKAMIEPIEHTGHTESVMTTRTAQKRTKEERPKPAGVSGSARPNVPSDVL